MAIRNAAKAIIIDQGKVLLNRCKGFEGETYYDLPGGGQRQFETIEEALIREVMEETGYAVRILRFAALAEIINLNEKLRQEYSDYSHKIYHIFLAELADTKVHTKREADFQQEATVWLPLGEIQEVTLSPRNINGRFSEIIASATPVYLGSMLT